MWQRIRQKNFKQLFQLLHLHTYPYLQFFSNYSFCSAVDENHIEKVCGFMSSLSGLEELHINDSVLSILFRDCFFTSNSTCKLKTLHADAYDYDNSKMIITPVHYSNFWKFVKAQSKSLTELHLYGFKINAEHLEIMFKLPALNEIFLDECKFQVKSSIDSKATSVRRLQLRRYEESEMDIGLSEILKNCPNVTKLDLTSVKLPKETVTAAIAYLKNLKELELEATEMTSFQIPTLQSYHNYDSKDEEVLKFLTLNPKLKSILLNESFKNNPAFNDILSTFDFVSVDFHIDFY